MLSEVYGNLSPNEVFAARNVCSGWSRAKSRWRKLTVESNARDELKMITKLGIARSLEELTFYRSEFAPDSDFIFVSQFQNLTKLNFKDCHKDNNLTSFWLSAAEHRQQSAEFDSKGTRLVHLVELTRLQELDLGCMQLGKAEILHLASISSLEHLTFEDNNRIEDESLKSLSALSKLKILRMSGCHRMVGNWFQDVQFGPTLQELDVSESSIGDDQMLYLSRMCSLVKLNMNKCSRVTNRGVQHLVSLGNLKCLSICKNEQLTSEGIASLVRSPKLERLDMSTCDFIPDDVVDDLKSMASLKELNIYLHDEDCCFTIKHFKMDGSWLKIIGNFLNR